LDDITPDQLRDWAGLGFDWIWWMGIWETGQAARAVARSVPHWQTEFRQALPDLQPADIGGSPFALTGHHVAASLGGEPALARLRQRMAEYGLRLMLDFVSNHVAIDHPWVRVHPEYFVAGAANEAQHAPTDYVWVETDQGPRLLAHGRDPFFPGWPDTLQLNLAHAGLQSALRSELLSVARRCDGVRCDKALLLLPEVFQGTWGRTCEPFWPRAIAEARAAEPDCRFVAEAYWDLEWTLQQQGFDWTYDKRLYDRLCAGDASAVRDHLRAPIEYQRRLVRFIENHDEARAASIFPVEQHLAAAAVTFLSPGLRLFHEGQLTGCRKKLPPALVRFPSEPVDPKVSSMYRCLLGLLRRPALTNGRWQLSECNSAWEGNPTHHDCLAWTWGDGASDHWLICVNYSNHQSQARVRWECDELPGPMWPGMDLWGQEPMDFPADELQRDGLLIDLKPWQVVACRLQRV
jgi:glycosidase